MRLTNHPRARHEIDCSRSWHEQDDRINGEHRLISALIFELTHSSESSRAWPAGIVRSLEIRLDTTLTYGSCSTGSACQVLAHLHHERLARGTASAWSGGKAVSHAASQNAAVQSRLHVHDRFTCADCIAQIRLLHVWQETSVPQLNKQRNASSALLRSRQKRTNTGVSTACRNIHINPHLFLTCPPAPLSKVPIAKAILFLVEHFTCVRLALLVKASELPSQAFCRVP